MRRENLESEVSQAFRHFQKVGSGGSHGLGLANPKLAHGSRSLGDWEVVGTLRGGAMTLGKPVSPQTKGLCLAKTRERPGEGPQALLEPTCPFLPACNKRHCRALPSKGVSPVLGSKKGSPAGYLLWSMSSVSFSFLLLLLL